MKLGVIFGGMSTEHDVSITSGTSVLKNLNKEKYDIYPIYISKDGTFYKYIKDNYEMLPVGSKVDNIEKIDNIVEYLRNLDVIFPVLHGMYGEDGSIEGLFEILKVPYVGCHVLSSSLCMDKVYTKSILSMANITVSKYLYIKKYNNKYSCMNSNFEEKVLDIEELYNNAIEYLNIPLFIKPSNSGSSVGVAKADNLDDFTKCLEEAFKYDKKVLIEEYIRGREVECAVLGNDDVIVSQVGEILNDSDVYTYDNKYIKKIETKIPADIPSSLSKAIQGIAKKAYKACDCKGLSRVDFFIEDGTSKIILNEINTMPGFTDISMYPKLMAYSGIEYQKLLDKLIDLAINKN